MNLRATQQTSIIINQEWTNSPEFKSTQFTIVGVKQL